MKTHLPLKTRLLRRVLPLAMALALLGGLASCGPTGAYWGVDQAYPIGNGQVYYGARGGSGHHYSRSYYKKQRKAQKKREKAWKKQQKKREKAWKKQQRAHKRARHHHHDHDD